MGNLTTNTTHSCTPCEVTWSTTDGPTCWSCGTTATTSALTDPTRPPRTLTANTSTPAHRWTQDFLQAHAMGLPDPRHIVRRTA